MEMLDQVDLLDEMNQIGFITRTSVTYKDGKRIAARGWHSLFTHIDQSYLNYVLNIRQKYSESVFLERYRQLGGDVCYAWELKDFNVNEKALDDRKITAIIEDTQSGAVRSVKR